MRRFRFMYKQHLVNGILNWYIYLFTFRSPRMSVLLHWTESCCVFQCWKNISLSFLAHLLNLLFTLVQLPTVSATAQYLSLSILSIFIWQPPLYLLTYYALLLWILSAGVYNFFVWPEYRNYMYFVLQAFFSLISLLHMQVLALGNLNG